MREVFDVFKVDVMKDENFQLVLLEYEKFLDGKIENLILIYICLLLILVIKVFDLVDGDMLLILQEF